MHALDLAKVAKAFGFAVPPRVNIKMGGGESERTKVRKRRLDESDDDQEEDDDQDTVKVVEHDRSGQPRVSKHRRTESTGGKKAKKEVYRQTKGKDDTQWTR